MIALLGAAVAVGLAGCGGNRLDSQPGAPDEPDRGATSACTAATAAPSPVITAGATMYETPESVSAALDSIRTAGEGRFAAVYAGAEVAPEQGHAIVYRVPSSLVSAEFDGYVREVAGTACIYLRDAAHAQVEVMALTERITADMPMWKRRGITINMVGPRHDGSGVTVGTLDVEAARAELPKHYGSDIAILVEKEGPVVPLVG